MKTLLLFTFLSFLHFSNAQEKTKHEIKASLSGQLSIATNGQSLFLTMGGPGLKMDLSPKMSCALNMLPSLRFLYVKDDAVIKPFLGFGPQFYYKKIVFFMPLYYLPTSKKWIINGGIGWKLK